MGHREAVVESVRTRIRPIFMTTLIGFFGLLPLVISPGAGSELYRGLGSVLLGGLLISTVFTLFLVPSLFSLALEVRDSIAVRVSFLRPTERHDHATPRELKPTAMASTFRRCCQRRRRLDTK